MMKTLQDDDKGWIKILWDVLFKFNMILMPLVVTWGIWVTSNIYDFKAFKNQGARVTPQDLELAQTTTREWVRNNYPPNSLVKDIEQLKASVIQIQHDLSLLIYKVDLHKVRKNDTSKDIKTIINDKAVWTEY